MALEKSDPLGIINNSPRARAIRHIQEWITDGRLAAGSRLPSEMRLASKLNVCGEQPCAWRWRIWRDGSDYPL